MEITCKNTAVPLLRAIGRPRQLDNPTPAFDPNAFAAILVNQLGPLPTTPNDGLPRPPSVPPTA